MNQDFNDYNALRAAEYTGVDPVQAVVTRVFGIMGFGLGLTALVSFVTLNIPALLVLAAKAFWLFAIAQIGLVIYLSARAERLAPNTAMTWFLVYSAVSGLTLAPMLYVFTAASITTAFLSAAGMFAGMAFWGYTTKKDLTSLGAFAFMGLIGVFIASIANMFFKGGQASLIISYIAIGVFIALTAWDTQKIKNIARAGGMTGGVAVVCALSLYLDFINLFIHLLYILGGRRN